MTVTILKQNQNTQQNKVPYITVPDPGSNLGSVTAAIHALKHNVNLLTVNARQPPSAGHRNLAGAQVFALSDDLQQVSGATNSVAGQIDGITNQIAAINAQLTLLQPTYIEELTVISVNVLSVLTKTYTGGPIKLVINGRVFYAVGVHPAFSVSGQTITWLLGTFNINLNDVVIAEYEYS